MVACHRTGRIECRHDPHVCTGRRHSTDNPGEEVLIVTLKHLPANELPKKGGHEHRQALDPSALVEETESCAGHAGSRGVGKNVVPSAHLLNLGQLGLEVLDGLMSAQIMDDPAQSLQTGHVDTDTTHFAGLGTESVANV